MTETYEKPLAQLHAGKINHQEFLRLAGCEDQYKKWCKDHHVVEDEGGASLFFDQHGFEDSAVVKEYIQPVG